jgi:hypothetical protein
MQTTHGQNDQRARFGCDGAQRPNTIATTAITQKSNPSVMLALFPARLGFPLPDDELQRGAEIHVPR